MSSIFRVFLVAAAVLAAFGCAHYPVNEPLKEYKPDYGYRSMPVKPESAGNMTMVLSFSGGGTRSAALAYGVLEELARTEIVVKGQKMRLLDQVDIISGVSGGSFTAAYYGLFGERIFRDFEGKFLKKDIQGDLFRATFFNPFNWVRLGSGYFDRSDLAAEYYDENVFEKKTFADLASAKGPLVVINATDMTYGVRIQFTQDAFDVICSDLATFPVGRACAASSAVPGILSPLTLRNYAGTCGYDLQAQIRRVTGGHKVSVREQAMERKIFHYADPKKTSFIHLIDGGVADNLGLRAILDKLIIRNGLWESIRGTRLEGMNKLIILLVNAETQPDRSWDNKEWIPPLAAMLSAYSTVAIERYNVETVALLEERMNRWAEVIRQERCRGKEVSTEPGGCGDFNYYLIDLKFGDLADETQRDYFSSLPTSFRLEPEEVDRLRDVAGRLLKQSKEYQRLLRDLK